MAKNDLPPQLGKWLVSGDPVLVIKAEAALRDAEPYTNDLLLEQIKTERKRTLYASLGCYMGAQMVFRLAQKPQGIDNFAAFCTALALQLPILLLLAYLFVRPRVKRCEALIYALARRGDVRTVPFLIQTCQIRRTKKNANANAENALLSLVQCAAPGTVPFSLDPKAKDPAAPLRVKFGPLTHERDGTVFFFEKATATPLRVQLWLALLPHLAADSNAKSRAVLRRIAHARAQTLDEELIQNTARALLNEARPEQELLDKGASGVAAPQTGTLPTATDDAPLLQRLGRRL